MIPRLNHARHRKPVSLLSRILLPVLAALMLTAGLIFALVPASAAPVTAAAVMADRAAEFPAVLPLVLDKAQITRAALRARARAAAAILAAHTYTVRPGDSVSSVAARHCGAARDWTGIYAASRAHRWTAANANVLSARAITARTPPRSAGATRRPAAAPITDPGRCSSASSPANPAATAR